VHPPFNTSRFPDTIAVFCPVFKKDLSFGILNYCPMSLTCDLCKIMAAVVNDQVIMYMLTNTLITEQQHGFLSRHSTCFQLIESVNDWTLPLYARAQNYKNNNTDITDTKI